MKRLLSIVAAGCAAWALAAPACAADWAATVVSYSAGSTYPAPDPDDWSFVPPTGAVNESSASATTAILEGITADTGYGMLTPFNGPFDTSHYVGVGAGGSITLQFAAPVRANGYTVGIHTASGLIDMDYPNGYAGAVATPYTTPRQATIAVSADNVDWFTLGTFVLDNPTNYYAGGVNTPGYQASVTGGVAADVNKPFLGNVSSFDGQAWSQMLATLDGSAGGNWIDLTSSGLTTVSYIRFSVPADSVLYLDAVVGLPAPEPASLALLAVGSLALLRRRRTA